MKQGLLVIDVQNDYFSRGKMPLAQPEAALHQINLLEAYFQQKSWPIIYIQHVNFKKNATFFQPCTTGVQLHSDLQLSAESILIKKLFPNSFHKTKLEKILKELGVKQLVITGMMTHMCVDSTTRAACELGFHSIVISDATATKALTFCGEAAPAQAVQAAFLAALGNFATVCSTTEYLSS
ncbi:cysteine hydrolase family protein [Candidatus Enterococcus ferrettii]|uniref:Isochorismatase-like domain-containing protein n=1 Tax=Candidatus Enterococcus ferrettii TaxID=2815324 RepID=A0ABV0ENU3_9ENTE|nr:cysteine hydrolase family protein [Enterococcus sp. 665A]MBO1338955.1 cysteine hydrolase [Enterococcus sp. 665A]